MIIVSVTIAKRIKKIRNWVHRGHIPALWLNYEHSEGAASMEPAKTQCCMYCKIVKREQAGRGEPWVSDGQSWASEHSGTEDNPTTHEHNNLGIDQGFLMLSTWRNFKHELNIVQFLSAEQVEAWTGVRGWRFSICKCLFVLQETVRQWIIRIREYSRVICGSDFGWRETYFPGRLVLVITNGYFCRIKNRYIRCLLWMSGPVSFTVQLILLLLLLV